MAGGVRLRTRYVANYGGTDLLVEELFLSSSFGVYEPSFMTARSINVGIDGSTATLM
jgi:hypothetical protein